MHDYGVNENGVMEEKSGYQEGTQVMRWLLGLTKKEKCEEEAETAYAIGTRCKDSDVMVSLLVAGVHHVRGGLWECIQGKMVKDRAGVQTGATSNAQIK